MLLIFRWMVQKLRQNTSYKKNTKKIPSETEGITLYVFYNNLNFEKLCLTPEPDIQTDFATSASASIT